MGGENSEHPLSANASAKNKPRSHRWGWVRLSQVAFLNGASDRYMPIIIVEENTKSAHLLT